ncbi:MAG: hypothetical protein RIS54_520 [Verrucomicrobiota bacterium]|jgi:translation initiation factor 1
MSKGDKVRTDGGDGLAQNPFGALSGANLPSFAKASEGAPSFGQSSSEGGSARNQPTAERNRGRVDIKRATAGRGGKTVTLVTGFAGIGLPEKEQLAKKMRAVCGCGGTVKGGDIEIQGDQREKIAEILRVAGFRPVFAGG